jgi:hypothetical protein
MREPYSRKHSADGIAMNIDLPDTFRFLSINRRFIESYAARKRFTIIS